MTSVTISAAFACVAVVVVALVALDLGRRFLVWVAAHEERRLSDLNTVAVAELRERAKAHDEAIDKLRAENRSAALTSMGRR